MIYRWCVTPTCKQSWCWEVRNIQTLDDIRFYTKKTIKIYINIKCLYMHVIMAATEDSFDIPGPETFMASQTMRPCAWKIKGPAVPGLRMRYPGPRPAWTASFRMMVMMWPGGRSVDVCFDPHPIKELGTWELRFIFWATNYLFGEWHVIVKHSCQFVTFVYICQMAGVRCCCFPYVVAANRSYSAVHQIRMTFSSHSYARKQAVHFH